MLEMRLKTKQDLIRILQESTSSIKRVVAKEVKNNEDLDDVIKAAKAIFKTDGQMTVFLIAC
jgi:hypothetical protein